MKQRLAIDHAYLKISLKSLLKVHEPFNVVLRLIVYLQLWFKMEYRKLFIEKDNFTQNLSKFFFNWEVIIFLWIHIVNLRTTRHLLDDYVTFYLFYDLLSVCWHLVTMYQHDCFRIFDNKIITSWHKIVKLKT